MEALFDKKLYLRLDDFWEDTEENVYFVRILTFLRRIL